MSGCSARELGFLVLSNNCVPVRMVRLLFFPYLLDISCFIDATVDDNAFRRSMLRRFRALWSWLIPGEGNVTYPIIEGFGHTAEEAA